MSRTPAQRLKEYAQMEHPLPLGRTLDVLGLGCKTNPPLRVALPLDILEDSEEDSSYIRAKFFDSDTKFQVSNVHVYMYDEMPCLLAQRVGVHDNKNYTYQLAAGRNLRIYTRRNGVAVQAEAQTKFEIGVTNEEFRRGEIFRYSDSR